MKKTFIILSIFISFFAISCKMSVQDKDLFDSPEIFKTSSGVGITITRYSQETKYINIYRRDITSSSENDAQIMNLGILYPSVYKNTDKTYFFEDSNICKKHKYQYRVRYCEPEGTYYSEWTDSLIIPDGLGYDEEINLDYKANDVKFTFNKTDMTLTMKGTVKHPGITNYDAEWKPVLAVSNDETTQVFIINSVDDGAIINLKSILSSEFFDREIVIEGILGQKIIYEETDGTVTNPREKILYWTPITSIKIQGWSGNIIQLNSEAGTAGYDYSL